MDRCPECGSAVEERPAFSGSPNMRWRACSSCDWMEPVFASDEDWQEWDMPVKFVDGCMVIPFEMLR